MRLNLVFLVSILTLSGLCFANKQLISTGTYVPFFNQVQVSPSGSLRTFEINPYVGYSYELQLGGSHLFTPEVGYVLFNDFGDDTTKDLLLLNYDFGYRISSEFVLRYGLTTHWYRVAGKGGTKSLSNGSSTTEFIVPSGSALAIYTTWDIGVEFLTNGQVSSWRFDLKTTDLFSDERIYNYLITASFEI